MLPLTCCSSLWVISQTLNGRKPSAKKSLLKFIEIDKAKNYFTGNFKKITLEKDEWSLCVCTRSALKNNFIITLLDKNWH
jgi:hypothetical protein